MRPTLVSLAIPFVLLVALAPANADPPPSGLQILPGVSHPRGGAKLYTDASGNVSALGLLSYGSIWQMNRVTPDGDNLPGWPAMGVQFGMDLGAETDCVADDGAGGSWHVRQLVQAPTRRIELEHLLANATSGWNGLVISGNFVYNPAVANDGGTGAFVSWWSGASMGSLKLLRVQANGVAQPGWSATGATVLSLSGDFPEDSGPPMLPDGSGGVFVLANCYQGIHLVRVNGAGAYPSGWGSAGLLLTALNQQPAPATGLAQCDASHVFAWWLVDDRVVMRRVAIDGSADAAWDAGVEMIPAGLGLSDVSVVPDGLGGALVLARTSGPGVRLMHVQGGGSPAPGFEGGAISPLDNEAVMRGYVSDVVRVAAGSDGGAIVCWDDMRAGDEGVRARWLLADGASDPNEPVHGRRIVVSTVDLSASLMAAMGDGEGGAYVQWQDQNATGWDRVFLVRAQAGAFLGVPPGAGNGLALAAGPNPVRGELTVRFTLPDARPARLELLDLAGRRVAARDVRGDGAHAERLGEAAALPPGVYLLRLTHGTQVGTARVALVR